MFAACADLLVGSVRKTKTASAAAASSRPPAAAAMPRPRGPLPGRHAGPLDRRPPRSERRASVEDRQLLLPAACRPPPAINLDRWTGVVEATPRRRWFLWRRANRKHEGISVGKIGDFRSMSTDTDKDYTRKDQYKDKNQAFQHKDDDDDDDDISRH